MEELLSGAPGVGVFAVFALLVFREVRQILKERKADGAMDTSTDAECCKKLARIEQKFDKVERQVSELWTWHNKEDHDGVKVWYYRQSLGDAIERMSHATETMTAILEKLVLRIEQLETATHRD